MNEDKNSLVARLTLRVGHLERQLRSMSQDFSRVVRERNAAQDRAAILRRQIYRVGSN